MQSKRYRVSARDHQGDLHSFETDEAERALAVLTKFRENLNDAKLEDQELAKIEVRGDQPPPWLS